MHLQKIRAILKWKKEHMYVYCKEVNKQKDQLAANFDTHVFSGSKQLRDVFCCWKIIFEMENDDESDWLTVFIVYLKVSVVGKWKLSAYFLKFCHLGLLGMKYDTMFNGSDISRKQSLKQQLCFSKHRDLFDGGWGEGCPQYHQRGPGQLDKSYRWLTCWLRGIVSVL